ncbi:MAG: hypothetical protein PHS41_09770, partial [Victivallaceae bacterium]|nr:hypothetical protein [Victivallaceae bacterium]
MSRIKTAFVCNMPDKIDYVYGSARRKILAEETDLFPEIVTAGNFEECDLGATEAIFSTWGMPAFSEEEIRRKMPQLKALFYAAGATDGFARPFLHCGIKVVSGWQANAIPVAEYTVSAIVLGLKNFFQLTRSLHEKSRWNQQQAGRGSYGATVALIGAGAIAGNESHLQENHHLEEVTIPSRAERRTASL